MFKHDIQSFLNFGMYVFVSIVFLATFIRIFIWWTPHDEIKKIREGNISDAITISGVSIGFTIPLLAASYFGAGFIGFLELAVLIGILQLILEKILDKLLVDKNIATAVLHSSLSICLGLICAFSIIP